MQSERNIYVDLQNKQRNSCDDHDDENEEKAKTTNNDAKSNTKTRLLK